MSVSEPFIQRPIATSLLGLALLIGGALGYWALPAGYMDHDELPEEALRREVTEETGLSVQPLGLAGIVALGGWEEKRGILLVYRAEVMAGEPVSGDDASEVRWFSQDEIPWDEIAFPSTTDFLREWLAAAAVARR